jgi:hypothetical protein
MIRCMNGSRRGKSSYGCGIGTSADPSLLRTGFGRISVGLYRYYSIRYHRVSASLSAAPLSDHRYQLFETTPSEHSGVLIADVPFGFRERSEHLLTSVLHLSRGFEIRDASSYSSQMSSIRKSKTNRMRRDGVARPHASADIPGYPASSAIQNDIPRSQVSLYSPA